MSPENKKNCADCGVNIFPPRRKRCAPCHERQEKHWKSDAMRKWNGRATECGTHCSRCHCPVKKRGICAKCLDYVNTWKRENRDKVNGARRLRRRELRDSGGRILSALLSRQGGRCALCGIASQKWHRDHVIPRSRGGQNGIDNLQALCPPCNLRKHAKILPPGTRFEARAL